METNFSDKLYIIEKKIFDLTNESTSQDKQLEMNSRFSTFESQFDKIRLEIDKVKH